MSEDKKCTYNPAEAHGAIGMHHCPECGEMQLAGYPHIGPWTAEDDLRYAEYLKENPSVDVEIDYNEALFR